MELDEETFNVVIDKGTLDSILVSYGSNSPRLVCQYLHGPYFEVPR